MKKMNGGSTAHLLRSARKPGQPASWMMARRSRDNSNSKMTPVSPRELHGVLYWGNWLVEKSGHFIL